MVTYSEKGLGDFVPEGGVKTGVKRRDMSCGEGK